MKKSYVAITILSLFGIIPISFNNKKIKYEIHTSNIPMACKIKEEVIAFYKDNCYASSYFDINKKINKNKDLIPYKGYYKNNTIFIYYLDDNIEIIGYLYESCPPYIEKENYFK